MKKSSEFIGNVASRKTGENYEFIAYYLDKSNWSSGVVRNGTFNINKKLTIYSSIKIDNKFSI